jgi:Beta propeller domain
MTHARVAVFASAAALVALGAAGCTGSGSSGESSGGQGQPGRVVAARLTAFRSCADAIAGLRRATEASVGPYGLPDGSGSTGGPVASRGAVAPAENAAAGAPAAAAPGAVADSGAVAASGTGAPAFSGTNTYVPGVDEPDLVKTDGRYIITLSGNALEVVDAASRRITGRLDLSPYGMAAGAANLLLSGDHALLLADGTGMPGGPAAARAGAEPGAGTGAAGETDVQAAYGPLLLLVGLAGQPRVLSSYRIEGSLVDARQVGSVVRVVTGSGPQIVFPAPASGASGAALTAANRAVIAKATVDAWLPHYTSAAGGTTLTGRISCDQVSRPAVYSGANLLTVLTFDLSASALGTGDGVSIAADGGTVYGTDSSLYVASGNRWQIRPATGVAVRAAVAPAAGAPAAGAPAAGAPTAAGPAAGGPGASTPGGGAAGAASPVASDFDPYGARQQTEVYRFSISQPGAPRYVASGTVPGYLVDQYAMSEWGGYLRIATTTGTSWSLADGQPQGAQPSSSAVYVLTTSGPVMRLAGQVGGLGAGERIYSVRFEGPAGYVVTFRQTDPLYTVDLRDPARPRVAGSLNLTGYSSYLHPASGTRLIGIGQQADAMGHRGGTQVSLFDVADPASPQRLATFALSGAQSAAEFDPHAFLYWPASHLVVVPIQVPYGVASPPAVPGTPGAGGANGQESLAPPPDGSGALVLRIDSGTITQAGFIRQPASSGGYGDPAIERSLVIGNTLWTVSSAGLLASDLSTLRQQSWIPFA